MTTSIAGRKMGGRPRPFNTFFLLLLLGGLVAGCATTPEEKQAKAEAKDVSAVRLHAEPRDESMAATKAKLPRSGPVEIPIDKEPFADERDVVRAQVVDLRGGFAIRLELTSHGRMVLEGASVTRAGLRLAIYGQWSEGEKETTGRWLAAPVMRRAIRDGVVVFTPDCDREEAERFVRGLNNVAIKLENQPKPKKEKPVKQDAKSAKPKKPAEEKTSGADDAIQRFEKSRK